MAEQNLIWIGRCEICGEIWACYPDDPVFCQVASGNPWCGGEVRLLPEQEKLLAAFHQGGYSALEALEELNKKLLRKE